MQCYMGTPCRQQYTHPGDATAQGSQICHRFFFHCTRSVISVLQQLQWLTLHERLAGGVIMMFCIIKDHVAVGTSFIIPPRATVRGHNQRFLIPYTRTDMYRTFLVHRDNLTIIFHHLWQPATPLTPSNATCTTTDSTRFHLMCVILLYILPTLKWLLPTPVNRWTDTLV